MIGYVALRTGTVKPSAPFARACAVAVMTLMLWSLLPVSEAVGAGELSEDMAARHHALIELEQAATNTSQWLNDVRRGRLEYRRIEHFIEGEDSERRILRVDQSKPAEQRVELLSIDGQPPDAEALAEFRKQRSEELERQDDDGTIRLRIAGFDPEGARLIARDGNLLVFDTPNALGSILTSERLRGLAEHLEMQVTVERTNSGPYFKELHVFSTAPFKPGLIGKVRHFEMTLALQMLEPDFVTTARIDSDLAARAFFRNFQTRQHVEFIGHIVHPPSPERASPSTE